jgi:hypothetical protein
MYVCVCVCVCVRAHVLVCIIELTIIISRISFSIIT